MDDPKLSEIVTELTSKGWEIYHAYQRKMNDLEVEHGAKLPADYCPMFLIETNGTIEAPEYSIQFKEFSIKVCTPEDLLL